MSRTALIARHEWRRLGVQPFAWTLAAIVVALMAWQFLLSLEGYLQLAPKLGAIKNAPGVTDLVAVPLLRSFSNLLVLLVPLLTMRAFAGERRAQTLPLLLASGIGNARIVLGKYVGALGFVLVLIALVLLMPLVLDFGTALDLGKIAAGARLQGISNAGINYLALPTHLEPFFRGLVASVDIIYFLLIVVVALALAARRLDTLRSRSD